MNDMNEQSGNSGQLPPDAVGGGDALARALSVFERRRRHIPLEVYEAFQELRAALAARQPVGVEPVVEIGECAEVLWLQGGPCQLPPGAKLYAAPPAAVPVGVEPIEFQHRFWDQRKRNGPGELSGGWSDWASISENEYERCLQCPKDSIQVRTIYVAAATVGHDQFSTHAQPTAAGSDA